MMTFDIRGEKVILVTYTEDYVEKFWQWMKFPELRLGSKQTTLNEERDVPLSLYGTTEHRFIVLDKSLVNSEFEVGASYPEAMIGYVNLINEAKTGEITVVIASPGCRGKGFEEEAVSIVMFFDMTCFDIHSFHLKIQASRSSLDGLKKLGFEVDLSCSNPEKGSEEVSSSIARNKNGKGASFKQALVYNRRKRFNLFAEEGLEFASFRHVQVYKRRKRINLFEEVTMKYVVDVNESRTAFHSCMDPKFDMSSVHICPAF